MISSAVILDLDGTLLDTRRRHHCAYSEALLELGGQPVDPASFWAAKRRNEPSSRLLAEALGEGPDARTEHRFLKAVAGLIEDPRLLALDRPQPGALRALSRLWDRGIEPVVLTARRDENALRRELSELGLAGRLADVIATRGSPKHAGVDSDLRRRVIAWIGDTEDDLAGARVLGVPVCLVTNGIRTRGRLAALHPDRIASSFGAAVGGWNCVGGGRD